MRIEQIVNQKLNNFPRLKKLLKRIYQVILYTFSSKKKCIGNIIRISPDDDYEYFFGYYDKSPWNIDNNKMLCLRIKNSLKALASEECAEIILINTRNNNIKVIGKTNCWNIQQGCMLQWLGPDYNKKIIYNDFRDGEYCSIILNIETKEEKVIKMPIYSVSENGKTAITLNFSRLHTLRPGYGYINKKDNTENIGLPEETCIWKIDLLEGKIEKILKYKDFYKFETRMEMQGREVFHKINHLMLSPNGKRFMVLYRWFNKNKKYTRLITCNISGDDMYLLNDDDMTSHCCWKNNVEILAFANKKEKGIGFYLMKDKTKEYKKLSEKIFEDGHPSYDITKKKVLIDTYPDRFRMSKIKILYENGEVKEIASVFSPFKYDNEFRCDLHPRWSRDCKMICFDSVHDGKRGLYIIKI